MQLHRGHILIAEKEACVMPLHRFSTTFSAVPTEDSVTFLGLPDTASAPMLGMLVALGQCTLLTLQSIVQRQRQTIQRYHCTITSQQRDQHPQIFDEIHLHIQVYGHTRDRTRIDQAWHLVPNYCPVHATIAASCPITHHITLEEAL